MCRIKNCERHEFNRGLCLIHLRESLSDDTAPVQTEKVTLDVEDIDSVTIETPKKKKTTKKVDSAELEVRKETDEKE